MHLFFFLLALFSQPVFAQNKLCPTPIKVGYRDNPPFKIEDVSHNPNKLSGFEIDFIKLIAKDIGCKVTFLEAPWARQLEGVKSGQIDLVASVSKTSQREQYMYFFSSYLREVNFLFMTKKNTENYQGKIKKFEDILALPHFILGVTKGNYYGKEFATALQNPKFKAHVKEIKSDNDSILKADKEEITAFLGENIVTFEAVKRLNLKADFDVYPLHIESEKLYFGYSKKSVPFALVKEFNQSQNKLIKNGQLNKIMTHYLSKKQIDFLNVN